MAFLGKRLISGIDCSGSSINDIDQVWADKDQYYGKAGSYWEVGSTRCSTHRHRLIESHLLTHPHTYTHMLSGISRTIQSVDNTVEGGTSARVVDHACGRH